MHENRHFLCTEGVVMTLKFMCAYAHYVTLRIRRKMASIATADNRLRQISCLILQGRSSFSVVGPLFPPCYLIFLEPCQVRGVSVFFVVFTLAFTIGQTSSGSLPFIGCFFVCLFFHLASFFLSFFCQAHHCGALDCMFFSFQQIMAKNN